MRIDRISVQNFIGVRSVDLPLNGAVTAVFGSNGSGKSSLCDAISFVVTGQPRRAKLHKKDLADLLHPGQKRGQASLQIDGVTYSRGIPTGNFSTASYDPPKGWELLLDPGAFLRLSPDDRRRELFRVLGVAMDSGSIMAKLVEHGYEEPVLARIRAFLRQGFAIAATECQGIAREKKGAWRQTTGQNWGWQVAKDWYAEVEVQPPGDLATLRKEIANLEGQIVGLDGQIGVARREQATAVQRAAQERAVNERAARARQEAERGRVRIAELRTQLIGEGAAKAERETAAAGVEEAERAWQEAQRAVVLENPYEYTCGSCGRAVVLVVAPGPLPRSGHVKLAEPTNDAEVVARVALVQAKRVLADAERQLEKFDRTRTLLAELEAMQFTPPAAEPEPAPAEPPSLEPLLDLEAKRQTLATQLQEARTAVRQVEDHQQRVAQAKQRTADAAALHEEIQIWLRLAEDLGPEGIPAQLLHSAIDPINESLSYSGNSLGFMGLSLTPEMDLVGRPEENDPQTPRRYELLSESARWRAEAALAAAISEQLKDGIFPIVLDRFDVCDGPNRGRVIRWLLSIKNQSILLGTLRSRDIPQTLPEGVEIHWLTAGSIMPTDAV